MTELKEIISKNLRKYRKAAKISQTALAKQLGISPSSVSNWEQGLNSIDIDTLFKVCKILDVPISRMTEALDPEPDYILALSEDQKEIIEIVKGMDKKETSLFLNMVRHIIPYVKALSLNNKKSTDQ